MRILLLNQFFSPDSAATAQLLGDVSEGLASVGHQVTVICGAGEYCGSREKASANVNAVRIRSLAFRRGAIGRLASYASFLAAATACALVTARHDVVVSLTTPPGLSFAGWVAQRFRETPHVIWEMDVYPDISADIGQMSSSSWLYRALDYVLNIPRSRADGIIALGPCMKARLLAKGLTDGRIHVCENWATGSEAAPEPWPGGSSVRVVYSGNFGLAHELGTIRDVVLRLANDPRFEFTFAGGGARQLELQGLCRSRGIENVTFRPYCSRERLISSLAEAHVGLVTQESATVGSTVPSKVYGLMAAARPILYIGPARSTTAALIEEHGCGWTCDCGDLDRALTVLHQVNEATDEARIRGERGYRAFEENYSRRIGVSRIMGVIEKTAQRTC